MCSTKLSLVTAQYNEHLYFSFIDVNEQDCKRNSHPKKDQADTGALGWIFREILMS